MKKQKLKNYLKYGILLFGISIFFIACQKEKINFIKNIEDTTVSYKVVSLNQLTKLKPIIENIKQIKPKTDIGLKDFSDFLPLENIDHTKVIQYTNETGFSTYTFIIENENQNTINFENLLLLETEEGYIGYILSYEPDLDWYNNHLVLQHGEYVLLMDNYQGDITKFTFERELIWSTKNIELSKSDIGIECTISVYQYCSCNTPEHTYDNLGNCSCVDTIRMQSCPGGGSGGGGAPNNNNDENCETSGTIIIDEQPLTGVNGGCAPNDETAVIPPADDALDLETECEKIDNFFYSNHSYKVKIQTLATKVTDNKEHSHTFHEDGSEYQEVGIVGSGGIDYPEYASNYKAFAHIHDSFGKDGLGTLSVFSIEDLVTFAKLAYYEKLNTGTFVAFLATNDGTNDGTKYALTINNKQKLVDLFYAYLDIPLTSENALKLAQSRTKVRSLFKKYYYPKNLNAKLKVDSDNTETDLEEFLNFMGEADLGITLFESTDNFNSFKKVDIKNNTVDKKPCN